MGRRRIEGYVEGQVTDDAGNKFRHVFFPSIFEKSAQIVVISEGELLESGVDLETDRGPGARPIISASADIEAASPELVEPRDLRSEGYLPSLDSPLKLR